MRGGARQGSGRKKGQQNRKTSAVRRASAAAGILPCDYMLKVMRDTKADKHRRDDMAKAAAPYFHPRLAAVEHTGKDGGPIQTIDWSSLTDEQLKQAEPFLRALAGAPFGAAGAGEGGNSPARARGRKKAD